jgi:hypothetical protein
VQILQSVNAPFALEHMLFPADRVDPHVRLAVSITPMSRAGNMDFKEANASSYVILPPDILLLRNPGVWRWSIEPPE